MSLIAVSDALERLFALVQPLGEEIVPLTQAAGRVLARPVAARRDQPPFRAAAMDGYAVRGEELMPGAGFGVIGESAAGRGFEGQCGAGKAVRIFTGAPVPDGATHVVIQEDVAREGEAIRILGSLGGGSNIRAAGADFRAGDELAPKRLTASDVALLAAMNVAEVPVARAPEVAILATGDELVSPGGTPGADQIVASNSYGLHALCTALGARPRLLPIAEDDLESLTYAFELARGADLLLTIGGASVGDHDLVGPAAAEMGLERSFWKVAMRPGKPLMAGRLGEMLMIGLPGNPVSAMVCGHVFLAPVLRAMQGLPAAPAPRRRVKLAAALPPNGPREHYLRARTGPDGVRAFDKQDSSLLSVLSQADCLIVQPPDDPGRPVGADVEILDID